ncbi:hypothetical protein CR513_45194, partial [Mucuna pruriens]
MSSTSWENALPESYLLVLVLHLNVILPSAHPPATSSLAPQSPTRSSSTTIVPTNDFIVANFSKFVMRTGTNYLLIAIEENHQRDVHLIILRHQ